MRHIPNIICLLRIALIWPVLSYLGSGRYGAALGVFAIAAVSDGLDGFLAKRYGWTSELGRLLDPLADKLLLVAVFIAGSWIGLIPWWLAAAVVARDVLIVLGATVFRLWLGPLNGRPTLMSKINTTAQLLFVVLALLRAATGLPPHEVLMAFAVVTFATTVLSGVHYVLITTRRALALPA